jgi:glycosyltransferase involved in cell wall biosynthesis
VAAVVPDVSFTATNLNTVDRLPASLASVRALAASVARPYEIVIADGPSDDGASDWLARESGQDPHLRIVRIAERNRGKGRRIAFEASRGRVIVPFDTSLAYDASYGPILERYVDLAVPKMLFSEVCAFPRSAVEAVGGWRDLIGGEDVDLYARLIDRIGVLAYPTGVRESQSATLGSYARQMRYVRRGSVARLRRIYAVQRDQIIASHASVADLMAFNARKPLGARFARRAVFTAAALGARLSRLKPIELGRNNYLVVREGLFESFLSREWKPFTPSGAPPQLPLTDDEFTFLERRSTVYQQNREALAPFLVRKG